MRRVAVLLAGLVLLPAGTAQAHGADAAADLLGGDVSYPVGAPRELQRDLDGMVRAARAKGYAVKIALVQDRFDVEQNRSWLYDPQAYADFLAGVLPPGQAILTVNPNGFGGNGLGEAPATAVSALQEGQTTRLDELVRRAMRGVAALTRAHGTPVPLPASARAAAAGQDDGGTPFWLVVGLPVLLVGAAVLGLTVARRPSEG